ncbi:hypothetical protein [uncultured Photobacterium sp.]|uniref:hypothetical protein n=1 Tax=uncultured Photobacterium sp. TaxID=173973 RepID=UPI0026070D7A|nr:hypothetical protein [uncultured Photobacterium sp.]
MKKGIGVLVVIISFLMISNMVAAKDSRVLTGKIALEQNGNQRLSQLALDVPVGKIEVRVVNGDAVTYKVKIEDDSSSWSLFSVDLDTIKVSEDVTEQTASLKIDEDDVSQKWTLIVPPELALSFRVGVGNLNVDSFSQSLFADIGVGSAWISVDSTDYRSVLAEVGVGEIQMSGFEPGELHKERAVVSEELRYSGTGAHTIDINIGVGDVNLSRQTL